MLRMLPCVVPYYQTIVSPVLTIHVEGEGERGFAQALGLILQLLQLALRDTAEHEQKLAGGGALAAVDMPADDDGEVLLVGAQ